ncbi:MAG: hypothetical protein LBU47_01890 [Christensenellaceae bacterium]|nr:hypothetical protein [Christensenellaceae bacterium]
MAMPRPHEALRRKLKEYGIDYAYLAQCLGRSEGYVGMQMRAAGRGWAQAEMYSILKMVGEPPSKVFYYFPPGGAAEAAELAGRMERELEIARRVAAALREFLGTT